MFEQVYLEIEKLVVDLVDVFEEIHLADEIASQDWSADKDYAA